MIDISSQPARLESLAPISVALAVNLQRTQNCSFAKAWSSLIAMLEIPPCLTLSFQRPDELVCPSGALQQTELWFASRYSVSASRVPSQHIQQNNPIQFVTWNVRGLLSSMPAVHQILQDHRPLVLVLTETHLQTKQASMSWVRNMHPAYEVHTSCVPQVSQLGRTLGPGRIDLHPQNKAGVLIAVHKSFMPHQYVSRHAVPTLLHGYLHHVSIHSPSSHTLHVLAAYCPPMSSPGWKDIQQGVFHYVGDLQPRLENAGSKLLLAGDLNATFHSSHRSHNTSLAIDKSFRRLATQCKLRSCFVADPAQLPHSCRSFKWADRFSSSRLDHFCTFPACYGPALETDHVHNVMYDALYDSSDHFPVKLSVHDAACLVLQMPLEEASHGQASGQAARNKTPIAFSSFPPTALMDWQAQLAAKHSMDISHTSSLIREASEQAQPELFGITQAIQHIICSAVSLAQACLPCKPASKPVRSNHKKTRRSYLPRVMAHQYACQLSIAKACRLACKHALACQRAHITVQACTQHADFLRLLEPADTLHDLIADLQSYDAVYSLLQQHRQAAQSLAKQLLSKHQCDAQAKQTKRWHKLYYSRRKLAYAQVFQAQDDRGSAPTEISAVNHPLYGRSANPSIAIQALHYHHTQLCSPKVSCRDTPFPWGLPGRDNFVLQSRGSQSSLLPHLTREVYDLCVKQLKNGKSPGPDQLPNELIKHFPHELHTLIFDYFRLCWKHGKTPDAWKQSLTLLFYKKGDPAEPGNYRPIALLNTIYKLWTSVICHLLSNYCEQHGILSEPQEGFRKHKDCQRQLQYLKLVIEDAKMHNRDLYISLLDIKSAFDTVDHAAMFRILRALGIPEELVNIIEDLHTHAATSILTNHGTSRPIFLRRGTIQGDSLSPLLFILFMEPLVRWLQTNDRGYRCMSPSACSPHYANVLAAADDIALLSSNPAHMQLQLDKVHMFAAWSGMQLAPHKCEVSAILWGTHVADKMVSATDWEIIQPILSSLRIQGSPMRTLPPDKPFKYLGVLLTLTMDWKPHHALLLDIIKTKGDAMATSVANIHQKLEMERQCIVGTLTYHLAIAPFSLAQLKVLEAARARVIKAMLRLPGSTPSQMLFLPHQHMGCAVVSLLPIYAQVCADTFAACLNDYGRLGTLARALLRSHMQAKRVPDLSNPAASWVSSNQHMLLRKASILAAYQLPVRYDLQWQPEGALCDLFELATSCVAAKGISATLPLLQEHVIVPLWQCFGYNCDIYLCNSVFLTMEALMQVHPMQYSVQRAYSILLHVCCLPTCLFSSLVASPSVAAPPPTHRLFSPLPHAASPSTLQSLAIVPQILELSHIKHACPAGQSQHAGLTYKVQWCKGPRPTALQLRGLRRIGLTPIDLSGLHHPTPLHAEWEEMELHWSLIAHIWPGKMAAYEAQQLQHATTNDLPCVHTMQAGHALRATQTQAQHLASANIIPAYVDRQHVTIQFRDINPDKDVHPTGQCFLAAMPQDIVSVYDACGAYVASLSRDMVENVAKLASPALFPSNVFAAAIRGMLYEPLHDRKTCTASRLFKLHFCLPDCLMRELQATFNLRTEWFTSLLTRSSHFPFFASSNAGDGAFTPMQDAFAYQWLGSGFVNPGLDTRLGIKAVRWAIAACYEPEPVFNLVVVPGHDQACALHALLQHHYVLSFISIPAKQCAYNLPAFLQKQHTTSPRLPQPAIDICIVANAAGMAMHCPQHPHHLTVVRNAFHSASVTVHTQLHEACACAHASNDDIGFVIPDAFKHALRPPRGFHDAGSTHPCQQSKPGLNVARVLTDMPPLLLDADSVVYTDGSCRGTSLTAAWVQPSTGRSQTLRLLGPSSAQRTPLRGELVAIHAALHSPHFPPDLPLDLMTDSLTSQQLASAYLVRPTHLRFHKHRFLVAAIAQNLVMRRAPVRIMKVRAHIGVVGNEAADKLANEAHDLHGVEVSAFEDPMNRGPAWVQHWFGDQLSDLDTLRKHALQSAQSANTMLTLTRPDRQQSKTLMKVKALQNDGHAFDSPHSNAFWNASHITDRQRSLALQVRFGTLATRYRVAQWYPADNLPITCPLCQAPKDTIGHRLGSCTFPAVKNQICARHGSAVHAIASAIKAGSLGNCALIVDAECHDRYRSFPTAFLPEHLQTSRPDIVLLQHVYSDFAALSWGTRRDPRVVVHILEVGYTSDLFLHECMQRKLEQHAQLCRNLQAFGWARVQQSAFIIGHTGAMLASNQATLSSLGITPTDADSLLKKLAITSLQKSCAILYTFASQSREANEQHSSQEHCILSAPSAPCVSSRALHEPPSLPVAHMPAYVGFAQPGVHSPTPLAVQPTGVSTVPVSLGLPCTTPSPYITVMPMSSASNPLPPPAMQSLGAPSPAQPMHKRRWSTALHDPQFPLASRLLSHSAVHKRQRRRLDSNHATPASTPTTPAPASTHNSMIPSNSQPAATRPSYEQLQTRAGLSPLANSNAPTPAHPHFSSSPRRTFDPGG